MDKRVGKDRGAQSESLIPIPVTVFAASLRSRTLHDGMIGAGRRILASPDADPVRAETEAEADGAVVPNGDGTRMFDYALRKTET